MINRTNNKSTKFFSIIWTFALIVPLIYFPIPSTFTGHPWKVELTTSLFLIGISLYFLIALKKNKEIILFSDLAKNWILLPVILFIIWSGLSLFWANSILSVLHHTLLWSGYLSFLIYLILIISNKKLLELNLNAIVIVIGIVSTLSIIEFLFAAKTGETFGFRYSRYTEIFATFLPIVIALILKSRGKIFIAYSILLASAWLAILFIGNRTALVSTIIAISIFFLFRIFSKKLNFEKKRLILISSVFILVLISLQTPLFNEITKKRGTIARINIQDKNDSSNNVSQNIRFLLYGVGFEMFSDNYIKGVGADNFGTEFNKYRATFSNKTQNKSIVNYQEHRLAERTHNEYLQILTELGLIGIFVFIFFVIGLFRLSFVETAKNKDTDILLQAATAGIFAFLLCSLFSSYSFRLMQNGLVFFFLIALLLRNHVKLTNGSTESRAFFSSKNNTLLLLIVLVLSLGLFIYSGAKATSQFLTYQAERASNLEYAKSTLNRANIIDPSNASAFYLQGLIHLNQKNYSDSSKYFRKSINKGLNTTINYSYLMTSYILNGDLEKANKTASETIKIFPYSVFARVRYAQVLKMQKNNKEAKKQLKFAKQINYKQANTWWILINNGAKITNDMSFKDKDVLRLSKLLPEEALYAYLAEREILHPEEKVEIKFNK